MRFLADLILGFTGILPLLLITLAGSLWIRRSLFFATALLVATDIVINVALKGTFQVPLAPHLKSASYAFPSGHMQLASVFYLWWMIYLPWLCRLLMSLILIGIAVSLVYCGYHTVADTIAGFLFGLLWVILYYILENKKSKQLAYWCFCGASLLMFYNNLVYLKIPTHAWKAYYLIIALVLFESIRTAKSSRFRFKRTNESI